MAVPCFGGNFLLWSLANETWYYVLFPLLVLRLYGKSTISRLASAAACLAIAVSVSGPIGSYFSLWLLGVALSGIQTSAPTAQRIAIA